MPTKMFSRRQLLGGGVALLAAAALTRAWMARRAAGPAPFTIPKAAKQVGDMPYRRLGRTGLQVSERGFGAWAIGGQSYGAVDRGESLSTLARAQDLGCNFVDTAAVYGDSESVLGEFLAGRRDRWIVSTKYSGQTEGMGATLEDQLRRLRTDYVDLYLIHWAPGSGEGGLFDQLERLKKSGKTRFVGISLYSRMDIIRAVKNPVIDAFMVALSLLDPDPFLGLRESIAGSDKAVIVRSALKEGFLAGKFSAQTRFTDPADQRSKWTIEQIERTVRQVESFRFLEQRAGSLARAAIAYPLSFPEVSSVVVGVKKTWEAEENFGMNPGYRLDHVELEKIAELQRTLGLRERVGVLRRLRELLP